MLMGKAKPPSAVAQVEVEDDESPLDTPAAAKFLNMSVSFLNKRRVAGDGPTYMLMGKKRVLYRPKDLRAWQASRLRKSTSDPGMPKGAVMPPRDRHARD